MPACSMQYALNMQMFLWLFGVVAAAASRMIELVSLTFALRKSEALIKICFSEIFTDTATLILKYSNLCNFCGCVQ